MNSLKVDSQCKLTLYHRDKRVSDTEWCDSCEISLSKQTAKKANDVVASYFSVDQEWDKKLLKCIFLGDELDWFEFNRVDTPAITLGVQMRGDRNVVFNESPNEFYTPIENSDKIKVSVKSIFCNNDYELDYKQISSERNEDFSIVALFNSNSFKRVKECSSYLGFVRTLEKLSSKSNL